MLCPTRETNINETLRSFDDWVGDIPRSLRRGFKSAYAGALVSSGVGRGGFRLGAALYDGHRLVSVGHNSLRTHPKLAEHTEWPFLHAEQHALFKAGLDNCAGMSLYVVRVGRDNNIRMSKPCEVCQHFIELANIENVLYSTEDNYKGWRDDG